MADAEQVLDTHIIGRGGLKIPSNGAEGVNADVAYGHSPFNVLSDFLTTIWEANGFDTSTEYPYNGRHYPPRAFRHELVLPPSGDKPLTVMQASFTPRSAGDIRDDRLRGEESRTDVWVETGVEEYAILVPPQELGPFEKLLSVTDRHGAHRGDSVEYRGTYIQREGPYEEYEAYRIAHPDDREGAIQLRKQVLQSLLATIINETTEFLQ